MKALLDRDHKNNVVTQAKWDKSDSYRTVSNKTNNYRDRKIRIQENLERMDDQN